MEYKVVVTAQTPIISGDKVKLTFPSTIKLPGTSSELTCTPVTSIVSMSCELSGTSIIIATLTSVTGGTINSGLQISFSMNPIRNPISLQSTSMSDINLLDTNSSIVNTYTSASSITI